MSMRFAFLMDVEDVRGEFNMEMVKKLIVYALEDGKTPSDAVDYVEEQLRHRLIRT